ncbi:MAG: protein tyrosine/serine phosphatase [Nevskia sp.]|nr:protein tyrosine/serine phosphatase [Nevskia sp.]
MPGEQTSIGNTDTEAPFNAAGRMLKTAPNFRNVGGLPAADGRVLRTGLIYRSGALDGLNADDMATLGALGVRLCLDLRSRGERMDNPSRWPEDRAPRILALEVATDIRVLDRELADWLAEHPDREGAERLMRGIYRSMPLSCAPVLTRLFVELVESDDARPVLIHCTAGKDRTGFIVAMLLKALGIADADVFADYLESNKHYDQIRQDSKISALLQRMLGFALGPEALQAVTCADRSYLAGAFEEIESGFGTADRYLQSCAGLDAARRDRLRQILLVPLPA